MVLRRRASRAELRYHFLDYITLLLFRNANVIHHVEERGAFIGENAKGTHGEIYKSHTSVNSAHFVDQLLIIIIIIIIREDKSALKHAFKSMMKSMKDKKWKNKALHGQ